MQSHLWVMVQTLQMVSKPIMPEECRQRIFAEFVCEAVTCITSLLKSCVVIAAVNENMTHEEEGRPGILPN